MAESQFTFVTSDSLRQNIDATFWHIAELISIVDDSRYPSEAKSAFCKSVIIHTGSVIEALLYALLDTRYSDDDIKIFYATWQLKPYKELHEVDARTKIVAGTYKLVPSKTTKAKLNLANIADILKENGDISADLHKQITQVRTLRNEQHLATQQKLKLYTRKDVSNVFKIARKVKEHVQRELSKK